MDETGTHSLPSEGDDSASKAASTKSRSHVDTADGYVETTVEGDTTTVVERHDDKATKQVSVTEPYTYATKTGKVTKQHTVTKTVTIGRTTVTKKTVTRNHDDYAERSATTTTVTYTYDGNGTQTGSRTSTEGPVTSILPRQTVSEYHDYKIGRAHV